MTWKVMSAAEVCDIMDFWAAADWPMDKADVQQMAVQRFGWTIEVDKGKSYLMNTVSGFSIPDVSTIEARGRLTQLSLKTSDVIRDVTPESTAFLGDAFTMTVREGEARWGAAAMREHDGAVLASWPVENGGRIVITHLPKSLTAMFETPQGAEIERKLGY